MHAVTSAEAQRAQLQCRSLLKVAQSIFRHIGKRSRLAYASAGWLVDLGLLGWGGAGGRLADLG